MTKKEILKNAKDEKINYIRLQFCDILGKIKNVEIPLNELENALDGKVMFDGSSIQGFVRIEETDMSLNPDLNTWLILDWEKNNYGKVARLICDVQGLDKKDFVGDPRVILKQQVAKMHQAGFENFNIGLEPEFYLFKCDEKGNPTMEFSDTGGYFDQAPLDCSEDVRRDIVLQLQKTGFNIEASHHEVGPGQQEINFTYKTVVEACDALQTFKLVVKNIAKNHGYYASFMAKPVTGKPGNGMHSNCSLTKTGGANAFYDEQDKLGLSQDCYKFIGGIIKHARPLTALTNPTVNSYKRLVPGYEAPCYISWSPSNRSTFIRIPASRGPQTRVEVRSVDPMANPYLALAAILAAGLDGIENNLECHAPCYDNLFTLTRQEREDKGVLNLPDNLYDATKELADSELFRVTLGEHTYNSFIDAKTQEWESFKKEVHDWEVKRYFSRY